MIELKNGESVSLTNGSQAKVVKELGRGGQGIVYLQGCTFGSIPMARVPNNETKRNLWLRDEIKAKRLL